MFFWTERVRLAEFVSESGIVTKLKHHNVVTVSAISSSGFASVTHHTCNWFLLNRFSRPIYLLSTVSNNLSTNLDLIRWFTLNDIDHKTTLCSAKVNYVRLW